MPYKPMSWEMAERGTREPRTKQKVEKLAEKPKKKRKVVAKGKTTPPPPRKKR